MIFILKLNRIIALSVFVLFLFAISAVSAQNSKKNFLPAPYKFPENVDPWKRESILGIKAEKPVLTKRSKAEYKQKMAPWLPVETEILTVILGRSPQFSPADKYRLLIPGHPEGSKNHLIALMDSKKLVFKVTKDKLKTIKSFKSVNYPGYLIRRSGDYFIFSDFNKRIEYTFFSRDAGFSWFVKNIRKIDNKNICLEFLYNDHDKITDVVMPDKKRFTIKYKNSLPVKIISPYGLFNVLKWNELSHISSIRTYLLPEHPLHPDFKNREKQRKKPYLIRFIKNIEHDVEGNLVGFINSYGDKFSAEYRHDKDKEAKTEYWCVILTPPSGKVRFCSKKHSYKTNITLFEKGYVRIGMDGTEKFNPIYSENRTKKAGVRTFFDKVIRGVKYEFKRDLSTTAITEVKAAGKITKKINYDADGVQTGVQTLDKPAEKIAFNADKKIASRTVDTVTEVFKYKDGKLVSTEVKNTSVKKAPALTTYKYEDEKTFKAVLPNETSHKFKLDELFRLTEYVTPQGEETRWKYVPGTDSPYEIKKITGVGEGKKEQITEYKFSPKGLIKKIRYPNKQTEIFKYKDGNIGSFRGKDKRITKYKYNQNRQLVLKTETGNKKTRYFYNDDGTVSKLLFSNGKSVKYKYDRFGRLIKRTAGDNTWEAYAYDQNGKKAKIRYSDRRVKYLP